MKRYAVKFIIFTKPMFKWVEALSENDATERFMKEFKETFKILSVEKENKPEADKNGYDLPPFMKDIFKGFNK